MNINPGLFVNRGPEGANMLTLDCAIQVSSAKTYVLGKTGPMLSNKTLYAIDLEQRALFPDRVETPPHCSIEAVWDKTPFASGSVNNILGDNGRLVLPDTSLDIPVAPADSELLAYYGATLIREGDLIQFANDDYPIFSMHVGKDYVDQFIMTNTGGGFYLEYHYDKPHFHMPVKGGGYYILAKWADEKQTHLHITAFQIRDGEAVYTKKGAIHCDAALTGDLIVGYDNSDDCSTVLLRNKENEMVRLQFQLSE